MKTEVIEMFKRILIILIFLYIIYGVRFYQCYKEWKNTNNIKFQSFWEYRNQIESGFDWMMEFIAILLTGVALSIYVLNPIIK